MAVDNKVSIEIVLDDGSVKRGFATIKKEAEDTGKKVEKDLNTPVGKLPISLTQAKVAFGVLAGAVAAVGVAIKKAFDFTLAGEKILATRAQFDNLAQSAGLSGQRIRAEFERVGDGLIDIEDLLEKAGTRITQLGANAERLPQILEASRRVAFATGRDVIEVFDGVANGIATGNARALRQFGLIVDLDKATKEYAASLGLGVNNLTEQQRQAAALSATISTINQRFGNVDQSLTPVTTSLTRLREAANDAFDSIAIASNELFGPGFKAVADAVTEALTKFNDSVKQTQGGAEGAASRIRVLKQEIESLQNLAAAPAQNVGLVADLGGVSGITKRISALTEEINLLTVAQRELSDQDEISRARSLALQEVTDKQTLSNQRLAQSVTNLAALNAQNLALLQQNISLRQQQLETLDGLENQRFFNQQILEDQKVALALSTEKQIADIRKNFADENGFTEAQRAALITQIRENEAISLAQINQKIIENDKLRNQAQVEAGQASAAVSKAIADLSTKVITESLTRVGASLVKGGDAFKDFGKAVLGIVGDIAINLGSTLIAIGLGIDALRASLEFLSGGAAIAAGAALIVVGGALKAASGNALTNAATSGASTDLGLGQTGNELISQPTDENDLQRSPNTVINVSFEGDVIGDSADTGSRIVSLINDAFDKQGVVLRQGVV